MPPPKLLVVNFPIIEYKFISYTILHTCIQFNIRLYKKEDKENNKKNEKKNVINKINLRCYVLLGCRVINVILAINIGDSAFFDIAALVRQFGGLRHHQQTESIHWPPKPKSWLRHCLSWLSHPIYTSHH